MLLDRMDVGFKPAACVNPNSVSTFYSYITVKCVDMLNNSTPRLPTLVQNRASTVHFSSIIDWLTGLPCLNRIYSANR
jgi:hypothetical protein